MVGKHGASSMSTGLFFDRAPAPCCMVDAKGRILRLNPAMSQLLPDTAVNPIGVSIYLLGLSRPEVPDLRGWLSGKAPLLLRFPVADAPPALWSFDAAPGHDPATWYVTGHPGSIRRRCGRKRTNFSSSSSTLPRPWRCLTGRSGTSNSATAG
ncbi:MAG: hypothetical protein HC888_10215 [Candidatus Competibacteraceae bacterium]|nr:hypothetical protein [Candidatus Competibacteraceae bacterium]